MPIPPFSNAPSTGASTSTANNWTANQTFNGTANTAPNQTAASTSSLLTRGLFESVSPWARPYDLKAMTLAATSNASTSTQPDALSDYLLTLVNGSAGSGNYARGSIGGFGIRYGYDSATAISAAWSLSFEMGMNATPSTFQFGLILGTAAAATSLVPSARAFSFRVNGSGTGVIGIHNGTSETTSTLSNCGVAASFPRYILVWSGNTTNVLSLYCRNLTLGSTAGSVNLCGSVTLSPGANALSGAFLTVMLEATGSVSQGFNPASGFTIPKFYPWAVIQ